MFDMSTNKILAEEPNVVIRNTDTGEVVAEANSTRIAVNKSRHRYYNPNPLKKVTSDCVVRAICKATGKDWDTVFEELLEISLELKAMPSSDEVWKYYMDHYGFVKHSLPVVKGKRRLRVEGFARSIGSEGAYVLNVANHLVTCSDGFYYDLWDSGDRAVYNYYEYVGVSEGK